LNCLGTDVMTRHRAASRACHIVYLCAAKVYRGRDLNRRPMSLSEWPRRRQRSAHRTNAQRLQSVTARRHGGQPLSVSQRYFVRH